MHQTMQALVGDKYKVLSVISMEIESVKPIMAPSYLFYPETKEAVKIEEAKRDYLQRE